MYLYGYNYNYIDTSKYTILMTTERTIHVLMMIIGLISLIVGLYLALKNDDFKGQLLTIVIGITLAGTGLINYKKLNV